MSESIDTTQKSIDLPFSGRIENNYYEGLLDKKQKSILRGYDLAIEAVTDAWYNLDDDDPELLRAGLDPRNVDISLLDFDNLEEEWCDLSKDTRLLIQLKWQVEEYLETARQELIVSLIDGMSERKYRKRYKKVFGKDCKSCLPSE